MAKRLEGKVVSNIMNKTLVVLVERLVKYPKYKKYVRRSKKYKVHDENKEYKVGDKVIIEQCKPISKDKHFKVVSKI